MFPRQSEFDKYFEKASAAVALPPALFKAIVGVETQFNPTVFNRFHPDKYGLAGMTIESAKKVMGAVGETDPRCIKEPEAAILMLAHTLRFYYTNLANQNLFPDQQGFDPDMHDVVVQYCKDNKSSYDPEAYWHSVFNLYMYFSQREGEPQWVKPEEMDGVYIRKRKRDPLYL